MACIHYFPDKLYAVGGSDGTSSLATVEIYDPSTQTWSFGPTMRIPRANVGVVVNKKWLYALGGFSGKAFLDSLEYLPDDGSEWCSCVPTDPDAKKESGKKESSQKISRDAKVKGAVAMNGNHEGNAVNSGVAPHVNGST